MTKAAVRQEVSRASPTLQSHFTETGKNLFDLHDLLDPFGLIAGGSQSRGERRLFFFFSATCLTFYLPAECVRLCAQPAYVCLANALPLPVNFRILFKLSHNGQGFSARSNIGYLHMQQG